jgi:hypothetical protein
MNETPRLRGPEMIRSTHYEPAIYVCWRSARTGVRPVESLVHRRHCPICAQAEPTRFVAGRCRSGRRWFWYMRGEGLEELGITDSENEAWAAIRGVAMRIAPAAVCVTHGGAKWALIKRNMAKRPATDPDAGWVYYVSFDGEITRWRILCKTERRIFYVRRGEVLDAKGNPTGREYPVAPGAPEAGWMSRAGVEDDSGPDEIRRSHFTSLDEALAAGTEVKREQLRETREAYARAGLQLH